MAASMKRKKYFMNIVILTLTCLTLVDSADQELYNAVDKTTTIPMDNAVLNIINNITKTGEYSPDVSVWSRTSECHTCELENTAEVSYNSSLAIFLDTRWKMRLQIRSINSTYNITANCSEEKLSQKFVEYGSYNIYVVLSQEKLNCRGPFLMNNPADSNRPIYIILGALIALAILYVLGMKCYRGQYFSQLLTRSGNEHLIDPTKTIRGDNDGIKMESSKRNKTGVRKRTGTHVKSSANQGQSNLASQDLGNEFQTNINQTETPDSKKKPKKERLKSLDTFRGISIIVMIFVNYGGGKYWFFKHSKWNGLTIADLVFPWFVFIMGTSMAYSYTSLLRSNTPKYKIFWKIFKRSCILFLLGLTINSGGCKAVDLDTFRIPGVLQRFAGTYLIIATMHMFFARLPDPEAPKSTNPFRDITDYIAEWIINFGFIGIYCGLTFGLDVPNCPKGYLGPGGLADDGKYFNCTGGAAGYIDRMIFGEDHIYNGTTSKEIYKNSIPYDPEGLLGTLTSCVICFLGLQAGKILMAFKKRRQRVKRFLIWGCVLCLLAGILCKFSKDDGWMPVNKNLWSVSFVLCTGGFAFILLTFCYLTIDEWKVWNGAPFYYPGMNSILLYMGHEILHNHFPISWKTRPDHKHLLLMDTYGVLIWVFVALICYKKKTFFVI